MAHQGKLIIMEYSVYLHIPWMYTSFSHRFTPTNTHMYTHTHAHMHTHVEVHTCTCIHSHNIITYACAHAHVCTHYHSSLVCCAAVTPRPTIVQATDDTVDLSPTVVAGEALTLSCTVMGILDSRINWYRGDSRVIINSRTQITEIEINATAQLSVLIISSTVEGDSGTYECRVENDGSTTSLQYQVAVGERMHYVLCMNKASTV